MTSTQRNPILFAIAVTALVILLPLSVVLGPIGMVIIIVVVLLLVGRRLMVTRQYALLHALAAATGRGMPLVPVVDALAGDGRGAWARRMRHMADLLRRGVPLSEALERTPGVIPKVSLPLVRIGEANGSLAVALSQASATENFYASVWHSLMGRLLYLWLLPCFCLAIVAFLLIKIVPVFAKIFEDFGAELPRATQWLIAAADLVWFLWPAVGVLTTAMFCLAVYAVLRYTGWTAWDPPGIARLARRFDTAAVLDALTLAADVGQPLDEAVELLVSTYPKRCIRRRLRRVGDDIAAGMDWRQALLNRGLINQADLAVLQSATRVGNLAWAMRQLADSSRRRLAYRIHGLVQVLFPLCVLMIGLIVLFVVVGIFMPLVTLVYNLSF